MKSILFGALCGMFLVACGEEKTGDTVPADHPHPDMVPIDHDHPEAKEVEPSFGTGLWQMEGKLVYDTCSEEELPTEYHSMGAWYVAATQNEFLFFPSDGGLMLAGSDGHYFYYEEQEFDWNCLAETFNELSANLDYTELELDGEIRLDFSIPECQVRNEAGELEVQPFACERTWDLRGERL